MTKPARNVESRKRNVRIIPWDFVYRVNWYRDGKLLWSRRVTEHGAKEWMDAYRTNRADTLSKQESSGYAAEQREWRDSILIQRAPVGGWETFYSHEANSYL